MNGSQFDVGKNSARGVAALLVCAAHAYGLFLYPHFGAGTLASGFFDLAAHQSVMVFFAISGFLITKSILANLQRNATFSLRDYLYARVARVYPPLVFSVLLTVALFLLVQAFALPGSSNELPYQVGSHAQMREVFSVTFKEVWRALKMQNGLLVANGPLWSLYIEWWIYIVAGLVVSVVSARGAMRKMLLAGVFTWAAATLYSVNSHALFYLGIWVFGSAMAVTNLYAAWFAKRQPSIIGGLLLALCLLAWTRADWILAGGRVFGWWENATQFIICAFWCSLILPDQRNGKTLAWRALFYLGECSYSLYILHFPLMLFMLSVLQASFGTSVQASLIAFPLAIAVAVGVAHLSSVLFEDKKRFLEWIRVTETRVFSALLPYVDVLIVRIRGFLEVRGLILPKSARKKKKREKTIKPALNDLDERLAKYLNYSTGFFIECGANNGYAQSNTYYLEKQLGWRGLLVEGIPELYEACKEERPASVVKNCALVAPDFSAQTVTMHYCNLMSVVDGSMKSTEMQEQHLKAGFDVQKIENKYSVEVPARTLSSLLDEVAGLEKIDFFSLDVEGYELDVLKGLDFSRHRPVYILVEARFFDEINDYLTSQAYTVVEQLTHHDYLYKDSQVALAAV